MNRRRACSDCFSGLLLMIVSFAEFGHAAAQTRAPAVQSVVDCRNIQDSAVRLACYDRAIDGLISAETSGDVVTVDRAQRGALRRQAFGFNLPALSLFGRDEGAGEDRLTSQVAFASRDGAGRWTIRLPDGAVWSQTDDAVIYPDPKQGSPVVIRRGTLGSYFMSIDGKPGVRALRRQ